MNERKFQLANIVDKYVKGKMKRRMTKKGSASLKNDEWRMRFDHSWRMTTKMTNDKWGSLMNYRWPANWLMANEHRWQKNPRKMTNENHWNQLGVDERVLPFVCICTSHCLSHWLSLHLSRCLFVSLYLSVYMSGLICFFVCLLFYIR